MDDLISRQAAIDAADAVWSVTGDKNVAKVWDQIKDLPSAQPDKDMIHLQKEQAYMQGWEEGRKALREEMMRDADRNPRE